MNVSRTGALLFKNCKLRQAAGDTLMETAIMPVPKLRDGQEFKNGITRQPLV
jgi:hypothetical protein